MPVFSPIMILSTCPADQADMLATLLVEARLAACVNISSQMRSVYRWQEKIELAEETLLIIKTQQTCFSAVEKLIKEHHRYEVPEIITIPITEGSEAYLQWIAQETTRR